MEVDDESVVLVTTIVPGVVDAPVKVDNPVTFSVLPTNNDLAIPIPPAICVEPEVEVVESVVLVIVVTPAILKPELPIAVI